MKPVSEAVGIASLGGLTLHIDTPLRLLQPEGLERSLLAKTLCLVDPLVASIVSCSWVALGVFVCSRGEPMLVA